MKKPSISIVIPTLNCEKLLGECLNSIENQNYPKTKIEILIVDGDSTDGTLEIAGKFTKRIFSNPLKTAEAGKAVGVKKAKNDLIVFIDSDNILPSKDWLKRMVEPFQDKEIIASEPLYYTYREKDPITTRYFALLGMGDPFCLFIGNYDRFSYITGKWTELKVKERDEGKYLKIELNKKQIPTLGANGFMMRRELIKKFNGKLLFDIDIVYDSVKNGNNKFAKVKIGIIHIFSKNLSVFVKKQERRIKDYNYYKRLGLRKYLWPTNDINILKFIISTVLIIPLLAQTIRGFLRKQSPAWLLHPLVCWITLIVYSDSILMSKFSSQHIMNRDLL